MAVPAHACLCRRSAARAGPSLPKRPSVGERRCRSGAASREQTGGIEGVNRAIADIDRSTQQIAALVEQAAAASESMCDQTRRLTALVSAVEG